MDPQINAFADADVADIDDYLENNNNNLARMEIDGARADHAQQHPLEQPAGVQQPVDQLQQVVQQPIVPQPVVQQGIVQQLPGQQAARMINRAVNQPNAGPGAQVAHNAPAAVVGGAIPRVQAAPRNGAALVVQGFRADPPPRAAENLEVAGGLQADQARNGEHRFQPYNQPRGNRGGWREQQKQRMRNFVLAMEGVGEQIYGQRRQRRNNNNFQARNGNHHQQPNRYDPQQVNGNVPQQPYVNDPQQHHNGHDDFQRRNGHYNPNN